MTATDSRVLLGFGYSEESPMAIYEEKLNGTEREFSADTELMFLIGKASEHTCRKVFEHLTGISVVMDRGYVLRTSKTRPWMAATLDSWYKQDRHTIPVEFKHVSEMVLREWREGAPLAAQIQLQHQMGVTGAGHGHLLAVGGHDAVHVRLERDEAFIAALVCVLEAFRRRLEARDPPPPDDSESTRIALGRLFPNDDQAVCVYPAEWDHIGAELRELQDRIKELEKREAFLGNLVRASMGTASYAMFPCGVAWSWKTQHNKAYTKVVEEHDTRVFRKASKLPKVYESTRPLAVECDEVAQETKDGEVKRIDGGGEGPTADGQPAGGLDAGIDQVTGGGDSGVLADGAQGQPGAVRLDVYDDTEKNAEAHGL
jgi:predicted phage-related endonuclease